MTRGNVDLIDPEPVEIEDLVRRYEGSVVNALRGLVPTSTCHHTHDSHRRPWNGAPRSRGTTP